MTEVTKEFIQKNEDEKIIEIEIERLRSFKNHPFQVKENQLTLEKMQEIMSEIKKGEITRVAFTNEQLHKYFPSRYTPAMMKREIIALLKIWQNENWEK